MLEGIMKRPGGEMSSRPLHFIWITDCSGSMTGEKIQSLNYAIRNAIPSMRDVASENPNAKVLVRAIKFSSGAQWHIDDATAVDKFEWKDLQAGGLTDLGVALSMVADQLKMPPMSERALPPVLVLLSDGQPTDDYKVGLSKLLSLPWGKKAVKIAIAIGEDADIDVLQNFVDDPERAPLQANNSDSLVHFIKWASTAVVKAASAPPSQLKGESVKSNVAIPTPPPADISNDDVW